ncbi:HNH endonuclease signature motif containing protein [Microbacterium sp. PF5]|uniref:HNH endonuclease signature motif containing protein n=1 Tax=Microbacterium sp. PF5 TaxID=2305435 RepID=UPI00109BAB9D
MPRAPRQCPSSGCDNRITTTRYCEEHTVHHWTGRSHATGTEHAQWRKTVLARAKGTCEIRGPRCTHRATDADHRVPVAEGGARYDPDNGQAACTPCHKAKTQQEAARGRARRRG